MRIWLLLLILISATAQAQLDPESSRLLRGSTPDKSLESSRYQVKPRSSSRTKAVSRVEAAAPKVEVENHRTTTRVEEAAPQMVKPAHVVETVITESASADETPVVPNKKSTEDQDRIHVEDSRINVVEVTFSPGAMYVNSNSQSWYRDYHSFSPSLDLEARVWFSPQLGFYAGYGASLAADISSGPTSQAKTPVDFESYGLGFEFRHFTNASRKAASYSFGIGYEVFQMTVPRSETNRIRLSTASAAINLKARLPSSLSVARTLFVSLLPKMTTKEQSTQVSFRSGSLKSAHGVEVGFGSEYIIDRKQQFFWKISHRVDKHVYDGASSSADPLTGSTLSGISVTQGVTGLHLGITWGD